MKIRVRLAKERVARFISHLDFAGAVEKAVRRAALPVAYSEGFTPRPKIAFGSALALGVTSEAEYADFELRERLPVAEFKPRLEAQLPAGIKVLAAREVSKNAPSLMAQINAASYQVEAQLTGRQEKEIQTAWEEFLEQGSIIIVKETKSKRRDLDIRPLILQARLRARDAGGTWDLLLRAGSTGNVRPEEVLQAFWNANNWHGFIETIHRTGLYIESRGNLLSPLVEFKVRGEVEGNR